MAKHTMDMVLEYAKVFAENRDMGSDLNNAAKKAARHNGQYVVNAYFTNEDQITELLEGGMDPMPMGNKRVKEGNDFGGSPKVVNLTNGVENKSWWSFEEDGTLGNGTKAKVQFETYSNGAGLRLIAIGVTDHVAWEDNTSVSADDELFMVG